MFKKLNSVIFNKFSYQFQAVFTESAPALHSIFKNRVIIGDFFSAQSLRFYLRSVFNHCSSYIHSFSTSVQSLRNEFQALHSAILRNSANFMANWIFSAGALTVFFVPEDIFQYLLEQFLLFLAFLWAWNFLVMLVEIVVVLVFLFFLGISAYFKYKDKI